MAVTEYEQIVRLEMQVVALTGIIRTLCFRESWSGKICNAYKEDVDLRNHAPLLDELLDK